MRIVITESQYNKLFNKINKKQLLKDLDYMGYDQESAIDELNDLIKYYNNLPDIIKLYRILQIDNEKDINTNQLGYHYSPNKKDLLKSHLYSPNSNYYLVTVNSPKELIDINNSISNNILYPNEQEITLKNKGRGVEIISIENIK
jgi:hypothetical protein